MGDGPGCSDGDGAQIKRTSVRATPAFSWNTFGPSRRFRHLEETLGGNLGNLGGVKCFSVRCVLSLSEKSPANCLLVNKSASYISRHAAQSCRSPSWPPTPPLRPPAQPLSPVCKIRTHKYLIFKREFIYGGRTHEFALKENCHFLVLRDEAEKFKSDSFR